VRASKSKFVPAGFRRCSAVGASESINATVSPVSDCVPLAGALRPRSGSATRTGLRAAVVAVGSGRVCRLPGRHRTPGRHVIDMWAHVHAAKLSTSRIAVQCNDPTRAARERSRPSPRRSALFFVRIGYRRDEATACWLSSAATASRGRRMLLGCASCRAAVAGLHPTTTGGASRCTHGLVLVDDSWRRLTSSALPFPSALPLWDCNPNARASAPR